LKDDDDKVVEINKKIGQWKHNVEEIKANIDLYCEHFRVVAKLQREKYNALIDQGFTKEQALELCKSLW